MRLITSQEQSWPSGLLLYLISHKWQRDLLFFGQNPQLAIQILFCPGVSTEHLFQALEHVGISKPKKHKGKVGTFVYKTEYSVPTKFLPHTKPTQVWLLYVYIPMYGC